MWYFLCVWKREYYCGNSEKEVNVNLYLCQWYSDRTQIGTPEIRVSKLSYLIYPTDFCLFCIFLVMTLMRLDIIIGKETWIVFFPLTYTWWYYIVFVYYYIYMYLYIFLRNYFAYTLGKGKYFRAKNYLPKWNRFILLWRIRSSKKVTTYKPRQISVFLLKWSFWICLDLYTCVIKEVDDLVPLPSQCFGIFKVLIWLLTIPTIHFYILVISPNNTKKGRQCGKWKSGKGP